MTVARIFMSFMIEPPQTRLLPERPAGRPRLNRPQAARMRLTTSSPQDRLRELPRWNSDFRVFVFEVIAHPVIFLHGQGILSRRNARLLQPFRVYVKPACTILHNSTVPILPLAAQEPVDEDLGRARMGRIFNDANNAECIACRQPFFGYRRGFDRQPGFDKWFGLAAAQAESDRDFSFG